MARIELTLSPANRVGDEWKLVATAKVTDDSRAKAPVEGVEVVFSCAGTRQGSDNTDPEGRANCEITLATAGSFLVDAVIARTSVGDRKTVKITDQVKKPAKIVLRDYPTGNPRESLVQIQVVAEDGMGVKNTKVRANQPSGNAPYTDLITNDKGVAEMKVTATGRRIRFEVVVLGSEISEWTYLY